MFEAIYKTTKESIIERLSSPLMGSFVIAWCLWNYKFFVILFSKAGVTHTFHLIESIVFPDFTTTIVKGAILPLATALAYIFIYPYPALKVYEFTLQRQRASNKVRQQIEDETPLTVEESRSIRAKAIALEKELEETADRLNQEITTLKADLQRARRSPKKGDDLPESQTSPLDALQLELMKNLNQAGGNVTQSHLIGVSSEPRVKAEFALGELVRLGLLERGFNHEIDEPTYEFTHEGRRKFIEHVG